MAYKRYNPIYTKHDWNSGEIISEELLDRIEDGIVGVAEQIGNADYHETGNTISDALIQMNNLIKSIQNSIGSNGSTGDNLVSRINTIETKIGNTSIDSIGNSVTQAIINLDTKIGNADIEAIKTEVNNYLTNNIIPSINQQVDTKVSAAETAAQQAQTAASSAAQAAATAVNDLIQNIYGQSAVNNEGSNSLKAWISTQISNLNIGNINTSLTTLGSNVSTNQTKIAHIIAALGDDYSDNINSTSNPWSLSEDSISTRLDNLENSSAILDNLSTLEDKIEATLGRSLEPTAAEIQEDPSLNTSMYLLIKQLMGILGVEGGTSGQQSNLLATIDSLKESIYGNNDPYDLGQNYTLAKVLDDLYGSLVDDGEGNLSRDTNSLIDSLKSIPASINAIQTDITGIKLDNTSIHGDITALNNFKNTIKDAYIDANIFTFDDDSYLQLARKEYTPQTIEQMNQDTDNTYLPLPKGGGGGAISAGSVIISRVTEPSVQVLIGKTCNIEYTLEARDNSGELTGNGTAIWYVGGIQVATSDALNSKMVNQEIQPILNSFDISPYLTTGNNNVVLQVSVDTGGDNPVISRKSWTVNMINFYLTWNYNEDTIFDGDKITLEWTPYGSNINKTTHILIDGVEVATSTVMQSGIIQTITIDNTFSHGVHECEIYLTATINGVNESTDSIYHDLIVVRPLNLTPIISSSFVTSEISQYDTISIPVVIYTPNYATTASAVLAVDGVTVSTWTNIDRTVHYWNYSSTTAGDKVLTITVGSVVKTIELTVNAININNQEIEGYDLRLRANDMADNNNLIELATPSTEGANDNLLSFSNNFDWINGGLKTERDANNNLQQYISIKAGTTMTINKKLFESEPETGLNFKIIMKTDNCSNYDAKILDCYTILQEATENQAEKGLGIELFAHEAHFSSTGTSIKTYYEEGTYLELEFEIYSTSASTRYMMCWIDGVMACARPCTVSDTFRQLINPANIIIGSEDCDVNIYLIKSYPRNLSRDEHVINFIADAPNAIEMKKRYNRNDILNENLEIDYNKLYTAAPDCRIWLYDIARMTTAKDDKVQCYNFKQMWKNGSKYYDGLTAKNAEIRIQGTSSVNYRKGAANTDINFSVSGCELHSGNGDDLLSDSLANKGMKLNDTSIPITYANMKVNFASCEQVNNMCNAMWYQNFQPYPSLSERDCMEFTMGVQFILDHGENEPTGEVPLFTEKGANRQSNAYYMYSIGNLGNSKKNTNIFHSDNECCVEINDNLTNGQKMIEWPENMDWTGKIDDKDHSYGMRFPDTKTPNNTIVNGFKRLVQWMADNNPNAATNEDLSQPETYSEYVFKGHKRQGTQILKDTVESKYAGTYTKDTFNRRMAKMLSECEDYLAMDSIIYHFLFIERHTMVDNVAKNTFWSASLTNQYINGVEQDNTEGYWIWDLSKNYDNDTSDGNNNEGQLVFDYGYEATDSQDGKPVFNASDSVWFVFASNLTNACATMFVNRENATSNDGKYVGAWNATAYHNFLLNNQQKIPERVWNECYWYDYLRTYENGIDTSWITFLDGGQKTHQRKHYETFQELYMASKYRSALSSNNNITLRGYTPVITNDMTEAQKNAILATLAAVPPKAEIVLKMYNKCYATVAYDRNIVSRKVNKGEYVTLTGVDSNGQPLVMSDTVINIYTAPMIQEIGDLSPLYPGQASFSAAYRLKSIKIGSSEEGYKNFNITDTETGSFDFSHNTMLERLEIQNLSNVQAPLSLIGCPALKFLDATGSTFTGYTFAAGGLLNEAYIERPTTIIMDNLLYLTDENLHINNTNNLLYITIKNCPNIDSFNLILNLSNLISVTATDVYWEVEGKDFKTLFDKIKNISVHTITGIARLTEDMGTFSIQEIGDTFEGNLKIYYVDNNGQASEYFIVTFFDLYGDIIHTEYVLTGRRPTVIPDLSGKEYLDNYNKYLNPNWEWGDETRISFKQWDKDINRVITDMQVFPETQIQYSMAYHYLTAEQLPTVAYNYYTPNDTDNPVRGIETPQFIKNYYTYTVDFWTEDDEIPENYPDDDYRSSVADTVIKKAEAEHWYAVYKHTEPALYNISLYNTGIDGEKSGEPLLVFKRSVVGANHLIYQNDFSAFLPEGQNEAHITGIESSELEKYAFLNLQPYIPSNGLQVTGDMDVLIKYYKTDDDFNNYFLNKLYYCDLTGITNSLPAASFFHNSNLIRLITNASNIGPYCFANFNDDKKRYFIFNADNITLGNNCFYYLNNAIIIFNGTGKITLNDYSFYQVRNCKIIIPNSDEPLTAANDAQQSFYQFLASSENNIYVTEAAYEKYIESNTEVPYLLVHEAKEKIIAITNYTRGKMEEYITEANEA